MHRLVHGCSRCGVSLLLLPAHPTHAPTPPRAILQVLPPGAAQVQPLVEAFFVLADIRHKLRPADEAEASARWVGGVVGEGVKGRHLNGRRWEACVVQASNILRSFRVNPAHLVAPLLDSHALSVAPHSCPQALASASTSFDVPIAHPPPTTTQLLLLSRFFPICLMSAGVLLLRPCLWTSPSHPRPASSA